MGRQFVEKWLLNERDETMNRELDIFRGGYPPPSMASHHFSGAFYFTASAESMYAIVSVPTQKVFRLKRMVVDNDYASPNILNFYNYPSVSEISCAALRMKIAGSQTEFIDDLDVPFRGGVSGGVYASCLQGSLWVRVQGILIVSD